MNFKLPYLGYIGAGILTVLGIVSLVQPEFIGALFGLHAVEPRGLSQIRGTFGAMYIGLGGVMLYGTMRPRVGAQALIITAVLVGAVAIGRLMSIVVDNAPGVLNIVFLLSELAVAGTAIAVLFAPATTRSDHRF